MGMPLPLEMDTLHDELEALSKIVAKWEAYFKETPLPNFDVPGDQQELESIFIKFRGEIRMVSRRADALAEAFDEI